jgi:hypothetical protein
MISIEGLRQSHGSQQEAEWINQLYELHLWVNHSMKHIFQRDEIIELRAPEATILKDVIGTKRALHGWCVYSNFLNTTLLFCGVVF